MAVVFQAYFDESGKRNDPNHRVTVVAGLLASPRYWTEFEDDWRKALERADVPYLHMSEFAHFQGPFAKFRNYEPERRSFLGELLDIATRPFATGIGSSVLLEHYEALPDEFREDWVGDPYVLSVKHVLLEAAHEADHLPLSDTIACFFEHSNQYSRVVEAHAEMTTNPRTPVMRHIESVAPVRDRRTCAPIQAADLLAYELRTHIERTYYNTGSYEPRYPIKRILRSMQQQGGVFDRDQFDRLLLKSGFRAGLADNADDGIDFQVTQ